MRNSRHETEHQARKYHRDAVTCMDKFIALGHLPSFPPWRDTLVHKQGGVQKRLIQLPPTRKEVYPTSRLVQSFLYSSYCTLVQPMQSIDTPSSLLRLLTKRTFLPPLLQLSLGGDMRVAIKTLPVQHQAFMSLCFLNSTNILPALAANMSRQGMVVLHMQQWLILIQQWLLDN